MNVVVIGGGKKDIPLFETLAEALSIRILGIIHPDDAAVSDIAGEMDISTGCTLDNLLRRPDIDLIIDLSGSKDVNKRVRKLKPARAKVINRSITRLLCQLLQDEGRVTYNLIDELTREHKSLYEIGLSLSSARNLSEVAKVIIQHATEFTNTPAGSLAVYDEENNEMSIVASVGFKTALARQKSWKLREGGLTSYILKQNRPVVISNISNHPEFINKQLAKEGIKSLIACPLFLDNKVVGIIYVDDYKVREFKARDISVLSLLSTYAAVAIEKAKLLEETKRLALTDDLTSLYNYRYFIRQFTVEISRAVRYGAPLSLIIVDIDHFKVYNDTNGHLKGNIILKQLANILKDESRASDIIARYGGEEFTILCPNTDKTHALRLAERFRQKVEEYRFPDAYSQPSGCITISAGVASYPEDSNKPLEIIDKADLALYMAKRMGRNRVCAYIEETRQAAL
ncbi:MAG: sensor domain-containing diguanylate cyclase [Actinomycetota bacterium]